MTDSFNEIKKYYNACRPDDPIGPDDPRWVDLASLRGSGQDVVSRMLREIELEDHFVNLLMTGFRGTGKTSLLKACQAKLTDAGYRVIHIDAEADYFITAHEEISVNDILLVMAMAIVDQGFGPGYAKRLWEDIKSFLAADVVLQSVGVDAGIINFKATLEKVPLLQDRLRRYSREHSLYDQVRQLIQEAQAECRKTSPKGLVLMVDSIDHLADPPETAGTPVTNSVLRLLRDTSMLRRLDIHIILTVPSTIMPYSLSLHADYGEPYIVPEARIFTRKDERDPASFSVMEEFVAHRVPLNCFDQVESVHSLIAASGGYLRELLRLLQHCFQRIDTLPVTGDVVEKAIKQSIPLVDYLPLDEYRDSILEILDSADHKMRRDAKGMHLMYQMIRDRVLLSYRNDSAWEGIHPFVMALVVPEKFNRLVFPHRPQAHLSAHPDTES